MITKNFARIVICGLGLSFNFLSGTPSPKPDDLPRRVYVDMVGDLFHFGHVNAFKKARAFGDYLIVGLCCDEDCASYKRRPIMTLEERVEAISACRYVDEVIPNAPLAVTAEFLDEHKIDIVVHGSDFSAETMEKYYKVAIERDILRIIPYDKRISTGDIIRRILKRRASLSPLLRVPA